MYRNDTGKFVSNIIILKLRNVIIILEGAVSLKDAYKLSQLPRIHLIQMSHYVAKVFFFSSRLFAVKNQSRYISAKKETDYSKMWHQQFPTVCKSTHRTSRNNFTYKIRHQTFTR